MVQNSTTGTMLQHMTYDSYGNVTFLTSSWATTTDSYAVENLWQGGWRDVNTGYYHFQERWYSPSMQWLSWDPANYPDGPSAYLPIADNPINRTDPKGLSAIGSDIRVLIWITIDPANQPPSFNLPDVRQGFYSIMGANGVGVINLAGGDQVQFALTEKPRPPKASLGWNGEGGIRGLCGDLFRTYYGELKWNPAPVTVSNGNSYNQDAKTAWVNLVPVDESEPAGANMTDYWANTVAHENFYHGAYAAAKFLTVADKRGVGGTVASGDGSWFGLVAMNKWLWDDFVQTFQLR